MMDIELLKSEVKNLTGVTKT